MILRSAILTRAGFKHGFTTREGGVSEGKYLSLNLGQGVGDSESHVESNLARVSSALGLNGSPFGVNQVHGNRVVDAPFDEQRDADAVVATEAGVSVWVRTADCVPILVGDRRTGACAAVHAGWRGLHHQVIEHCLERLKALGSDPTDLCAAIGPHIRVQSFEIQADVASTLMGMEPNAVQTVGERRFGDLTLLAVKALATAGLLQDHIDDLALCTFHDHRFFSYRRDKVTGRQGAFIEAC